MTFNYKLRKKCGKCGAFVGTSIEDLKNHSIKIHKKWHGEKIK